MYIIFRIALLHVLSHIVDRTAGTATSDGSKNSFIQAFNSRITFVDKTYLLESVVSSLTGGLFTITCPSGFGKTTNLRMMEAFFESHWHPNGSFIKDARSTPSFQYFKNLKVNRDKFLMDRHFAQYFVLYLDMDDVEGKVFQSQLDRIDYCVRRCMGKYKWLLEKMRANTSLGERDKVDLKVYFDAMNDNLTYVSSYSVGLKVTASLLKSYYQKKVIILVDNYESPLRERLTQGGTDFIENVANSLMLVYKNLYQSHVKDMEFVIFSGISSNLMEQISVFIKNHKFLCWHPLWNFCGFQEEDIYPIVQNYDLHGKSHENLNKFYGGYYTRKIEVQTYNPTSFIKSLEHEAKILHGDSVVPLWTKTTNPLKLISHCFQRPDINAVMTKLLGNQFVSIPFVPTICRKVTDFLKIVNPQKYNETTSVSNKTDFSKDANQQNDTTVDGSVESFFTYLLEIGYLSYEKGSEKFYIPNDEIKNEFKYYFTASL